MFTFVSWPLTQKSQEGCTRAHSHIGGVGRGGQGEQVFFPPAGAPQSFTARMTPNTHRVLFPLTFERLCVLKVQLNQTILTEQNVPPNTTRHIMHRGTSLPLTSCSNKAKGHSSCQCCSQAFAWRTNRGLFSVLPPPCHPARPRSTGGPPQTRVSLGPSTDSTILQLK